MSYQVNYNERSWAIDVIGFIKTYLHNKTFSVKDAGGEQTLKVDGGALFPDVLLFGDESSSLILQGWELKMPDTPINDTEFRENAQIKANALGLDSFLLWNVTYAHLYVRDKENPEMFVFKKSWDKLHHIKNRKDVLSHKKQWQNLTKEIIEDLNELFTSGELEGRGFIEAYESGGIISLILKNTANVAEQIRQKVAQDSNFKSKLTIWKLIYKSEYGKNDEDEKELLAKNILSNWVGKFLFAHILSGFHTDLRTDLKIDETATPNEVLDIFKEISNRYNFWTIFSDSLGLDVIPTSTWNQLLQFNNFLYDIKLGSISQESLSRILESTVNVAVRKLRGQYTTPYILAKLLVAITVKNPTKDKVIDPCSGSGTIIRSAMEQKISVVNFDEASKLIYASDQDHQANQITTFALMRPELMNLPVRIFNEDVFNLQPDLDVEFKNPSNGKVLKEKLGLFDTIVSNFPFVSQNGRKQYGNAIQMVNASFGDRSEALSGKSDISAYIPFSLSKILKDKGMMGIIITNAWLGTEWGDDFFEKLVKTYHLKTVITSGAGRWFKNSEVVTNILILEKTSKISDKLDTDFIILKKPLIDLTDSETFDITVAEIQTGTVHDAESLSIHSISLENLKKFQEYGLRGTMQFLECDWILNLKLKPLSNLVKISRGERRGWNDMFYPEQGHGIEDIYIRPVLKNSRSLTGYSAKAEQEAFSCSATIDELKYKGHTGALKWIRKFENIKNSDNQPLVEVLARSNMHWYEMQTENLADYVFSLNFDKRLFISKFDEPSFADQRLVCMKTKNNHLKDDAILHALLNSAISYLFIEGMFFGKGLGALDLNKNRFEKYMHILDFTTLDNADRNKIITSFESLKSRRVMDIFDELESEDRIKFDQTIIDVFKIPVSLDKIYEDLITLVSLRQTAKITDLS